VISELRRSQRIAVAVSSVDGQLFGWIENGVGLHGTQAEFVRVPMADSTLVVVPDGLDEGVALLAGDILSTAAFGAELAGYKQETW
jgi:threonine dehydrogenase-like Zn-dependent dehydrogenase